MIAIVKPPRDSFKQRHHSAAFAVLEQFAAGLIEQAKAHGGRTDFKRAGNIARAE